MQEGSQLQLSVCSQRPSTLKQVRYLSRPECQPGKKKTHGMGGGIRPRTKTALLYDHHSQGTACTKTEAVATCRTLAPYLGLRAHNHLLTWKEQEMVNLVKWMPVATCLAPEWMPCGAGAPGAQVGSVKGLPSPLCHHHPC